MIDRTRESGFSMIEVLLSVTMLGITFISLGGAVMTGVKSTKDMDSRNVVRNQALRYVERLHLLNFGASDDAAPTTGDLDAMFSDSIDPPDLSLYQLATPVAQDGLMFDLTGFEAKGTWEVRVNRDVDGNGTINATEALGDVLRIEVVFDGRPVLTTFRAQNAQSL